MSVTYKSKWKINKKKVKTNTNNKMKKGPFSKSEQYLIDFALKKVLEEEGIFFDQLGSRKILTMTRSKLPKNFWGRIAKHVPLRSVESIYDHTRRRLSSQNYRGKWTNEDTTRLKELVFLHGKRWTKIGLCLNRLPGACYDKWRDALKIGEKRKKGKWTQEERCKLLQLVTLQRGHEMIKDLKTYKSIKWTEVAEKIGTRSYLQCRNEWTRFFSPGSKTQLTISDTIKLINKIFSSDVSDESEIKWGELIGGIPAHKTYNKWRTLCRKYSKPNIFQNNSIPTFKNSIHCIIQNLPMFLKKKL
mmetsp:Transcript_60268/g.143201  ORF Transcript_60268/g.143201 Transcript_60268/m.143201 type:complete len:302 (+) Transcript_60268:182-1087(+)